MTLPIRRIALSGLLLALAACGGPKDPEVLLQEGDIQGAIAAIAEKRADVEKGSAAEKELVLMEVEARSRADEQAEAAAEAFTTFAAAHPDALTAKDFRSAVEYLRTYEHYLAAIDVMHMGKQRWPEDQVIDQLLAQLQTDSEKDPEAASKLKGLGYTSK